MPYTHEDGSTSGPAVEVLGAGEPHPGCLAGEDFERLRPLLVSVAFRILGSDADAQDAVQETFVRVAASVTQPVSLRAFLITVTTRVSIDLLRARRRRQDEFLGWPDQLGPADPDEQQDPARSAELVDTVSTAAQVLLERLSHLELAVFVLREVFGFGFDDIASTLARSPAACRQLAVRSRRHMRTGRARFTADERERRELAARLLDALRHGDAGPLGALLSAGVRSNAPWTHPGGAVPPVVAA